MGPYTRESLLLSRLSPSMKSGQRERDRPKDERSPPGTRRRGSDGNRGSPPTPRSGRLVAGRGHWRRAGPGAQTPSGNGGAVHHSVPRRNSTVSPANATTRFARWTYSVAGAGGNGRPQRRQANGRRLRLSMKMRSPLVRVGSIVPMVRNESMRWAWTGEGRRERCRPLERPLAPEPNAGGWRCPARQGPRSMIAAADKPQRHQSERPGSPGQAPQDAMMPSRNQHASSRGESQSPAPARERQVAADRGEQDRRRSRAHRCRTGWGRGPTQLMPFCVPVVSTGPALARPSVKRARLLAGGLHEHDHARPFRDDPHQDTHAKVVGRLRNEARA